MICFYIIVAMEITDIRVELQHKHNSRVKLSGVMLARRIYGIKMRCLQHKITMVVFYFIPSISFFLKFIYFFS